MSCILQVKEDCVCPVRIGDELAQNTPDMPGGSIESGGRESAEEVDDAGSGARAATQPVVLQKHAGRIVSDVEIVILGFKRVSQPCRVTRAQTREHLALLPAHPTRFLTS